MTQKATLPRQFDKIILTLENCLLPENRLEETPSQQDGLDKQVEIDLRILGCELIQVAGILLKLPQVAMATGQVLFQRFYYSKSFLRHNMETTAMSCICLASKIEEAPRRIRDVINVFHHIKQVRGQKPIQPMILDTNYSTLKTQVIKAERRVLKELGFCVHVKHPHKLIVMYLQVLGYEKNQDLMQMAWNFMNDSLRTDVFMRYNPESIACACIYLTARKINLPLPNNPSWYGVFKVTEDEILDISYKIMDLYRRHKPNAEALEQAVEELRKKYNEIRINNKTKVGLSTPPIAVTTVDRNNGSHNAWGGFISRAQPVVIAVENEKSSNQHQSAQTQSQTHASNLTQLVAQVQQQQQQLQQPQQQQQQPAPQVQTSNQQHNSYGQKRSHTRSRSRSRSVSHSPNDDSRSRTHKKTRHRSRSRTPQKYSNSTTSNKKRSSRYSKSPSVSPSRHSKKRDRKSPMRDKSDYYNNGDRNGTRNRDRSDHRRDRSREKRYSGHSSSNNHRSMKHQDRFRDRKR